jgi:DNA-binding LacI/PurR family transcriptional regulator
MEVNRAGLIGMSAMGRAKPTMEDVAQKAKVCKATVSLVLSRDPRVAEETRERVLTVVKNMDYQVNAMARALALRRKKKPIKIPREA